MKSRQGIWLLTLSVITIATFSCNPSKRAMKDTHVSSDTISSVNPKLEGTYWKLVALTGKPVSDSATMKEMYLIFKTEQSRVEGNAGCNGISGTYTLGNGNGISFSQMISTKMMCPGIEYETTFLRALSRVNHYHLKGDTLTLTRGTQRSEAKFIAKD